jgi:hypothetical protein
MSVADTPSWRYVILAVVGAFLVALFVKPVVGILLLVGVWLLHTKRKQRIQAIADATAMLEKQAAPTWTEASAESVPIARA